MVSPWGPRLHFIAWDVSDFFFLSRFLGLLFSWIPGLSCFPSSFYVLGSVLGYAPRGRGGVQTYDVMGDIDMIWDDFFGMIDVCFWGINL
jgi:hypothetical protein